MKRAAVILLAVLLLAFGGCTEYDVFGEVIAEYGDYLVVRDSFGELSALRLNDTIRAAGPEGGYTGTLLSWHGAEEAGTVEYDDRSISAYSVSSVLVEGQLEKSVMTLPDGESVDLMRSALFGSIYRLGDGTALLNADVNIPDTVPDWFAVNLPYDLEDTVERAYTDLLAAGDGFEAWKLRYEVSESTESERVDYYAAELNLSQGEQESQYAARCYPFDRETGERLELWNLFTVPESEALETLLALSQSVHSPDSESEAGHVDPDSIRFTPAGIELQCQGVPGWIAIGASAELESIVQSWAVPQEWHAETEN